MPHPGTSAPPEVEDRRSPINDPDSEMETDTFEDAVDNPSARSLTKRTPSMARRQAAEKPGAKTTDTNPVVDNPSIQSVDGQSEKARRNSSTRTQTDHLSNTANLDNVNLDDDPTARPQQGPGHVTKESKTLSLSSLTNALPSMPWSPPAQDSPGRSPMPSPSATSTGAAPAPPANTRKLTSPFSWLSRNATNKETATPLVAQTSPRRNTASSIATLTSNPEMMLSRLDEEREGDGMNGGRTARNSLKDRFKMVRLREEAGITQSLDDDKAASAIASHVGRNNSLGLGIVSPSSMANEDRDFGADKAQAPTSPIPTSPNPNLAPGTASGVSAGPSAMAESDVDWDLWQNVVYEGPAAVARTSPEELNRAITRGIPSAIRGVIWQVLAQSKNDELEAVYKELLLRGTDKEPNRNSNSTTLSITSNGNLSTHNDAEVSSGSSVHSDHSGINGVSSPTVSNDRNADAVQKAHSVAAAEKSKRQKEDAAMLQKLEKTIRRDLGARTSYSKFAAAAGLQDGLFGVCKVYALFDEGVGYAQGMNFLIMPLLFNMPEEEAFCLLVRLMNHYHLRDLFIQDMPGLHMHLYQFERLLEDLEPALYCHLHRRGISPHLYATQWFLTLFAYRFPLQLVLRIYDLIFSEGLSAIIRFGIVLMQKNAATLLSMTDMQLLTTFLKDKLFDVYIDTSPSAGSLLENGFFGSSSSSIDKEVYRADQLVRDACEVRITPETLKLYTAEWEERTRAEKEREAELENLRNTNASLAVKARKLEERIEACDSEQAAMATELVHTKVENEELKDENESLKGQVRELRVVIEQQPTEIEQAWKLERDDLMKRNEKVHVENQKLELELAELEEELVQTKMQYAEINSQHETLNRKWTDLKRQFT